MAEAQNIPTTPGGWQTLVIDPPWHFDNTAARGALTYDTMSDDEILRLPIAMITAPRAHLYLWTTDAHLDLAIRCMREWGFSYKHPFVWVKTTRDGTPKMGTGNYGRKAHELCLFGTFGGLPVQRHDVPTVFFAPPRRHSRKPVTLHEIAEQLSPGPRLEMFARAERTGWTSWGNELPPSIGLADEGAAHESPRARFAQWIEHQTFDLGRVPTEGECRAKREELERDERARRLGGVASVLSLSIPPVGRMGEVVAGCTAALRGEPSAVEGGS